jgi:acrylyl-CoA reductase (NADPH)
MSINFQALVLQQEDRQTLAELRELSLDDLPEKEMLVRVHYSTLNYKDALAVTGKGRVIRKFPIIPGIDLAGEVIDPGNSAFKAGDHVISTGWGMGEEYWGGLGQYARLDPSWPLLLPAGLDMRSAMVMGTGGFTAALCVRAIIDHGTRPEDGPVLVTGAGGGVGGVSVMLLAKLGYEVHAVSGRESLNDYLQQIGATESWAAVVDTVGGETLATVIAQTHAEGIVAACGNASGIQLNTTVFPFILRGVTLRGINSVSVPLEMRKQAWELIANTIPAEYYTLLTDREITLNEVKDTCEELLAGKIRGRVVVDMQV